MSNYEELQGIPDGWRFVKVNEVAKLIKGVSYEKDEAASEPRTTYYPILRANNIQTRLNFDDLVYVPEKRVKQDQIIRKGDIVICMASGSKNLVGKAAQATENFEGSFGVFCGVLRPDTIIFDKYLGLFFQSPFYRREMSRLSVGVNINNLRRDHIESLLIPLPSLDEQQRIVARIEELFTQLDAGVAALEAVRAQVKRYRQAVLQAAVKGKLSSYWRAKQYNELSVKAQYSQPTGWCWKKVKEVGKVQLGRQRAPQHHNGPYMRPYLRVANVYEDRIDTSDILEMNFSPEEYEIYKLKFGDILLNEGQSPEFLGRPAIYRDEVPGACFQNTLIRFQAYSDLLAPYALIVFRHYMHSGRFQKLSQITTNIAHLSAGRFAEIEFPLPPISEQEVIVDEVEVRLSISDQMEKSINQSLRQAARLRQSILQRAFMGKLIAPPIDHE